MGGYYSTLEQGPQTQPDPTQYGNSITPLAPTDGRAGDIANAGTSQQDPIQQLESQVGPARQGLGQALQQQQSQLTQAQADLSSPIHQEIQRQSQQLQALQPTSNRGGPIKRLLFSFLSGAGDAMRHDVGLPTTQDLQQRYTQNLIGLSNAQSMEGLRNAQTQMLQLVPRSLPNGEVIQLPLAHVATFDAAMARQQAPPANLNDQISRMVYADVAAGRDPNQNPQTQSLIQLQRSLQKPSPDTSATQANDYMALLSKAQTAGPMPQGALTDSRIMQNWLATNSVLNQQEKAQAISYLASKSTPGAAGAQAATKISLEDQNKPVPVLDTKQGNSLTYLSPADINARNAIENGRYIQPGSAAQSGKAGYAYDPQSRQTVLTSAGESQQKGYQAFRPVSEADIRKDTVDTRTLNDVASKVNNLVASVGVMDNSVQRAIISKIVDAADRDENFRVGAFGVNIPVQWLNNLFNSSVANGLSQEGRNYLVSLLSLREASMGLQRILTGTAKSNESQIRALQATLPGIEPDSRLALQKLSAFGQNLDMLRQGIPVLPGIDVVKLTGNTSKPISTTPLSSINDRQQQQQYDYNPVTDALTPVTNFLKRVLNP